MYGFVLDAIRLGCFNDFNKKMWQDISKVGLTIQLSVRSIFSLGNSELNTGIVQFQTWNHDEFRVNLKISSRDASTRYTLPKYDFYLQFLYLLPIRQNSGVQTFSNPFIYCPGVNVGQNLD